MTDIAPPSDIDMALLRELMSVALAEMHPGVTLVITPDGGVEQAWYEEQIPTADYARAGGLALCQMGRPEVVMLCALHANGPTAHACLGQRADLVARGIDCGG